MRKNSMKKALAAVFAMFMMKNMVNAAALTPVGPGVTITPAYYWCHENNGAMPEVFGTEAVESNIGPEFVTVALTNETVKGEVGIDYKNGASYKDNNLGIKITIIDWDGEGKVDFFGNAFTGMILSEGVSDVKVKIEFYHDGDETKEALPMKGFFSVCAYDDPYAPSIIMGDEIVSAYVEDEVFASATDVDGATRYEFTDMFSDIEFAYDTALNNNSIVMEVVAPEGAEVCLLSMYTKFGVANAQSYSFAEANKEEVTSGDVLTYNYTIINDGAMMMAENTSNILIPIDPALEVKNVRLMDINKNNVTSKYQVNIGNEIEVLDKDVTVGNIKFIEVQAMVKENPEVTPEKIINGKYFLRTRVNENLFGTQIISDESFVELYYNTTVNAPKCKVTGAGRYTAASNEEIVITPDKGYTISKVMIDGEEMDLSEMELGQQYKATFEKVNADHEVSVEVEKMPATITVKCLVGGTNEVLLEETHDGFFMTDEYEVVAPEVKGYQVIADVFPTNASGVINDRNVEVTYYYEKLLETGDINVALYAATAAASALGIVATKKRKNK